MLKLVNIVKTDGYIEADYIPETSTEMGHARLYYDGREEYTTVEEYKFGYSGMALTGLENILNDLSENKITEIPKQWVIMWY